MVATTAGAILGAAATGSTAGAALGAAGIGAAGSIIGGREAKKGAERAAEAQEGAAEAGIVEQRAAREAFEERVQPFVDIGLAGRSDLLELLGVSAPRETLDTSRAQRDLDNLIRDRDAAERSVAFWEQKLQADPNNQTAIRNLEEKRQVLAGLPAQIEQAQGRLSQMQGVEQQAIGARALPPAPEAINLAQLSPGARQLDLAALPTQAQALDRSQLPAQAQALDRAALPAAVTALSPDSFKDNPMLDFVLKEGFRGIREGAAGGGRVPDRDLVEFAQGAASTIIPQLQAQQFGQQQALRGQAIGEQAQQFGQQQALRGQALGEQQAQFGQQQALRGQTLQELLQQNQVAEAIRARELGEQATQFGQLGGLRSQALGEQQQQIANLQNLLGLGQASAVGQGQAALQTGTNIGNLLGNIGIAQAAGALGKAQATQGMLGGLTGAAGMGLRALMPSTTLYPRPFYQDGSAQVGPMMASGRFS